MSYASDRYKDGLSGQKPSNFYLDKEAHEAKEAGYRDYLRNQDLADQLRRSNEDSSSSSDDSTSPSGPPTQGDSFIIAVVNGLPFGIIGWAAFCTLVHCYHAANGLGSVAEDAWYVAYGLSHLKIFGAFFFLVSGIVFAREEAKRARE